MEHAQEPKKKVAPFLDFEFDIKTGHLVYWDPVERQSRILNPGDKIEDPHLMIAKIGQQNLQPQHLVLKDGDLNPIQTTTLEGAPLGPIIPPGLSGFIFFDVHNDKENLKNFAKEGLNKDIHDKNRAHIAQIQDIEGAGWSVYYAPLLPRPQTNRAGNPLHIIISPHSLDPVKPASATEPERQALTKVFLAVK